MLKSSKTCLHATLACALLAAAASPAGAGGNLETIVHEGSSIERVRWAGAAIPVRWRLNGDAAIDNTNNGNSTIVTQAQVQAALASAFDSWSAVDGSTIDFQYDGLTANGEVGLDGENIVTWRDPGATGSAGFLAMAAVFALTEDLVVADGNRDLNSDGTVDLDPAIYPNGTLLPAGTIVDSDISYNSEQFDWVVNPVGGSQIFDIEAVAAHEAGHMIGLSHSTVTSPNATMYPFAVSIAAAQLDQRTLEADDRASAGRTYPDANFSTSFATIAGQAILDPFGPVGADGVSVLAIDARTLEPVVEVFTTSRFAASDGPAGSFAIDGLPPGDYVLATQYFDGTDERFVWISRYNLTVGLSNVNNGNATASDGIGLGFAPRPEFWNAGESTSDDMTDPAVLSVGKGDVHGGVNPIVNTASPIKPPGSTNLFVGKNQFKTVAFSAGFAFSFFDVAYTRMNVGGNGYITFGDGDSDHTETVSDFLSPEPRIAALFDALNPATSDAVGAFWQQYSDRVEVTYLAIPETTNSPSNVFRVTLFRDGAIEIDYDFCRARDAIVGISPGGESPAAHEIDFSRTPSFAGSPHRAIYEHFTGPHSSPSRCFDLWGGKLRFTPRDDGGYDAEFEGPVPSAAVGLSSVSPSFGPEAGGTVLTVRGFGFTSSGDTLLRVGASPATEIDVLDGTTLTARTPAGAGRVAVSIENSNGSDSLPDAFTYFPPPSLASVDPETGPQAGGTFVAISGEHFTTTEDTSVTFGGLPLDEMRVESAGSITGYTPAGTGAVDVVVTNSNGSDTLVSGFRYVPPPTVSSVTPDNGPETGGTVVTIGGANFTVTSDTSVKFGSRFATHVSVLGPASLSCRTPAGEGTVDVEVTSGFGSGALEDGFTYNPPPVLESVSPRTGRESGGTAVTLTGRHFTTGPDTVVFFGARAATSVAVADPETITCLTPTGTGLVAVRVTNSNGSSTLERAFRYRPAPRCDSVTPSFGPEEGGTTVLLSGANFFENSETVVTFGDVPATGVEVIDGVRIRCVTPAGTDVVDVAIENVYGRCVHEDGFQYGVPPDIQCRFGNVNATVGAITPVIFVDGSIGDETRTVHVSRDTRVSVDVEAPPANVSGSGAFVIYLWSECPTAETLSELPFRLGDLCMPSPLTPETRPQPAAIFNNFGYPRILGRATHVSRPAPSRLFTGRLRRDVFIQGLIVDDSSPRGLSVTNGVKIESD